MKMTLQEIRFMEDESRTKLFMMQGMHYQPDTHSRINQVIKSEFEGVLL